MSNAPALSDRQIEIYVTDDGNSTCPLSGTPFGFPKPSW
jgi:hypothetical protein